LAGAETGRTTAGETTDYYLYYDKGKIKLGNMGHSFQTIGKHGFAVDETTYGKDLRSIFIPSPGYSFVECDLSQAEARVDAVLAKDFDNLKIFDSKSGIHRLTGSWVFDCRPDEIQKEILVDGVDRYHVSKTVRHAGERNMTPTRLLMMIAKPSKFCVEVLKKFHANQPNIRQVFHRDIREQIQKERVLISPNGRRRDFFGRINEETVNQGISQLPQAIVTDYMKAALPKVLAECRDFMRPLSEAHDGFLSEVKEGHEEEYGRIFKKSIEVGIDFRTCSLPRDFELVIPCEVAISKTNWQEMKEVKL
jgi:DNA polymerase-1